jgi:phosphoglycolate phosphatase
MRYRLAIFDFDGTLADSYPWLAARFNDFAGRFGCRHVDAEELERMRGLHTREVMARVGLPAWKLPALLREVRREIKLDAAAGAIPLFAGIAAVLAELHAGGVRLAVVSSNSEDAVRCVLGAEAAARIDHYGCGSSMFGKAAHFRRAVRRLGVPAEQALCIGDEVRDAEAARAAGLDFAAVAWGYARADSLAPHARYLFATPAELAAAFA